MKLTSRIPSWLRLLALSAFALAQLLPPLRAQATPAATIGSLTATPATVSPGQAVTLQWQVTGSNSLWMSADNGGDPGSMNGRTSCVVSPTRTTRYTLSAWTPGGTVARDVTVTVQQPPKPLIASFAASPATVQAGSPTVLSWSVSGANSVSISPGIGAVTGSSVTVSPVTGTTYTLTATNGAGSVTKRVTVNVTPPPAAITALTASPATAYPGQAVTLAWDVTGTESLWMSADNGGDPGSMNYLRSTVVHPTVSTRYVLSAWSPINGSISREVFVDVSLPPPPTIAAFSATPTTIARGNATTLAWATNGATEVSLAADVGPSPGVVTGNSLALSPNVDTTYTLTAKNITGTVTRTVAVTVLQPPVIQSFVATPAAITLGQTTQLAWSVTGATSVSISANLGASPGPVTGNSVTVSPTGNTLYTLTASGPGGTLTQTIAVAVSTPEPLPEISAFTASPATITSGSSTLSWSVTGATQLAIMANVGANPGTVTGTSYAVSPTATTVYTLSATNATGTVTRQLTVTVNAAPVGAVIDSLIASADNVAPGTAVTLSWVVSGSSSLWMSADNGGDPGSMNGRTSCVVTPQVTTRYALSAWSLEGTAAKSVTVTVGAPPPPPVPVISAFAAAPASIATGASTTLNWSVGNADALSISPGLGAVTGTSVGVAPAQTTTYTLTATNAHGNVTRTATVTVTGPAAPTIGGFAAQPAFIQAGGSSVLNWSVSGADSLAIAADVGASPGTVTGTSVSVSPSATTRYTLTATNAIGSSTASVLVTLYTPGNGSVAHPRIWLTPTNLATLRARAAANDAAWIRLRNTCDAYVTMPISFPDQAPSSGTINGGYQYMDYLEPATALALGYQVAKTVDPVRAAQYAAKEKELLLKLSDPLRHGVPTTDSGYSIRAYVPALALGYDWIHETLSDGERAQIFTEINRWVASFDQQGFGRSFPNGNYFAGYYCAKALGALATEGENPNATPMWNDWLNRLHFQMVQPYYAAWLSGGGAPDGWNYGPFETINMLRPIAAAFTAKGLDLIHHGLPFAYPDGHARWMTQFTWPDLTTVNDRGLLYEGSNPSPATAYWATPYAGLLRLANGDNAPIAQQFALELRAKNANDRPESWAEFLFHDAAAPAADYRTALSLRTPGDGQVAMRSAWTPDAVWGAFQAGPYTGYQASAEEYYDKGSLAIQRGGVQFLVNATGALLRHTPGTTDGDDGNLWNVVYNEVLQTQTDGVYRGRRLFNTFMAVRANGYWGQANPNPGETTTTLSRFEDAGRHVLMRGARLEQMYASNHPISGWTRTVAYLRPQLFVVYDRTSVNNPATDHWMAWHVAAAPAAQSGAAAGTRRFDVVDTRAAFGGNLFRGRVSTVLPLGHNVTTVDTFGRGKVYRLEVRPAAPSANATWLAVFDASASAASAATVTPLTAATGNILAGAVEGALVALPNGTQAAVVFSTSASPAAGSVSFVVPAAATYCLLPDLAPNAGYAVTASLNGSQLVVSVAPGGAAVSSAEGTLAFNISASGAITAP